MDGVTSALRVVLAAAVETGENTTVYVPVSVAHIASTLPY